MTIRRSLPVLDGSRLQTADGFYRGETSHPRLVLRYEVGQWQVHEITP